MRSRYEYVALELASPDLILATHAESELLCICLLCRTCTKDLVRNSGYMLKLPERRLLRLDMSAFSLQQQDVCFKCDASMFIPFKSPLEFCRSRLSNVASTGSAFAGSSLGY